MSLREIKEEFKQSEGDPTIKDKQKQLRMSRQRKRVMAQISNAAVVENPPLARALHATVEIDRAIPPERYQAVAEVIGYVMRQQRAVQYN